MWAVSAFQHPGQRLLHCVSVLNSHPASAAKLPLYVWQSFAHRRHLSNDFTRCLAVLKKGSVDVTASGH